MRWRRAAAWVGKTLWLLGPLATLVVFGGPVLLLHVTVADAERCFASIPLRDELSLPECDAKEERLAPLEALPFIGRPALRAREELVGRMAVWRYVDAAVGEPNREALARHFDGLEPAARRIWEGSMRLRMDEVGPPMPVPQPGALAFGVGDRATLDQRARGWLEPAVAIRTLEAVLVEGRLERAIELAERFRVVPSQDLALRVGALLCVGGEHQRGLEHLADVEATRAEHRTANVARHFGEVRVLLEACARAGRLPAPPVPFHGHAGAWDHRERLMSMRLRHVRRDHPACDLSDPLACPASEEVGQNLDHARAILRAERPRAHRLALFASLADSVTSSAVAERFATPRPDEPAWAEALPLFVDDWLEHVADAPFVTAERYERASHHVAGLDAPATHRDLVRGLLVRAAIGYAQRGELGAADRCLARAPLDEVTRVGLRAQAALVAGDRGVARERLAIDAPSDPWLLTLRAELTLPDEAAARTLAKEALAQAEDARVIERLRWLLLALGVPTRGKAVLEPSAVVAPPRHRFVGRASPLTPPEVRVLDLDDTLATWAGWLASDRRRESRYQAFAHRGDGPDDLAGLLWLGSKLASSHFTPEQTEMWLDALSAFDARRFSLRQVTFARWRAAAWRGEEAATERWRERYRRLAALSQREDVAELLQALRL